MPNLTPLQAHAFAKQGHRILQALEQLPQAVIAAVNGFALGGGTEVALACDFIYASEKAVFGLPEVSLGLIPGFGGTQRLMRKIPQGAAREWIFSAHNYNAQDAYRLGLVNRVTSPETLLDAAFECAHTIRSRSSVAVAAAKRAMLIGLDLPLTHACSIEFDQFALLFATDHPREGTSAFLEKPRRTPRFVKP